MHREIWTLHTASGRQQLILRTERGVLPSATISPDGRHIVYGQRRTVVDQTAGFVVEVAGGVPRLLCEGCTPYGFLSDSRRVIVVSGGGQTIRTVDSAIGTRVDVLHDPEGSLDRPHVSPDDRWIAFRKMTRGRGSTTYIAPVVPGRSSARETWQKVDESPAGRPCGWSPDASTVYLLLDTDGFRCLRGQRLDARTGRASGPVYPVHHFHMQMDDGPSTTFGNAVSRAGFLYERSYRTGSLWRPAAREGSHDEGR